MRRPLSATLSLALLTISPLEVAAWGVAGHQIVATIAQAHLYDSTRAKVAAILPEWTNGQMAPVAAWADRIRYGNPWSGGLHYTSPLDDHPPSACSFDQGFRNERNVFTAIANYSSRLADRVSDVESDFDLRFLVHFIGDVHQPLHLMERERGGNGDPIVWERRHMSLHGLWDTAMTARAIRDIHNYSRPLPSPQIEAALTGSIYDSYVRWILWEGVRLWWRNDLTTWLDCPSTLPDTRSPPSSQMVFGDSPTRSCAERWAAPIHQLTCDYVFPPHYDEDRAKHLPPPELATAQYYGRIQGDKVIERLLAQAGLRLASSLNLLLGGPRSASESSVNFDWLEEAEKRY